MRVSLILVSTLIAILVIGCSSIASRCRKTTTVGEHALPCYVYPGIQGDAHVIDEISHSDEIQNTLLITCLFDLPFSFVADTVCLPYDVYMVTCGGRQRNGAPREVEHKPTTAPTRMRSSEPPPADAASGGSP